MGEFEEKPFRVRLDLVKVEAVIQIPTLHSQVLLVWETLYHHYLRDLEQRFSGSSSSCPCRFSRACDACNWRFRFRVLLLCSTSFPASAHTFTYTPVSPWHVWHLFRGALDNRLDSYYRKNSPRGGVDWFRNHIRHNSWCLWCRRWVHWCFHVSAHIKKSD